MDRRDASVFDTGHCKPCPYHTRWWVVPILLALGGCTPRQEPPPQHNANLQMTLAVQPASPRQLDPTHFTVTLNDRYSKPITKAAVTLNLMMPDMDMGTNTVTLTQRAPGTYTGTGRFTMPGVWSIHVVASKAPDNAAQAFPVTVR